MPSAPLPRYGNPPVSEVVCGAYFQSLTALQVAHVGALWDRLKQDFPRTETLPPLPPTVTEGPFEFHIQFGPDLSPFPRVWFVSGDEAMLVQLQRDRLIINWRRRAPDAPYPSYDAIVAQFRKVFGLVQDFLGSEGLGVLELVGLELAYVNTLTFGRELADPGDIASVVPFLSPPSPSGNPGGLSLSALGWNAQFDLRGGEGNLHVTLNTTQRRSDGEGQIRLDLLARKFSPGLATHAIWEWFDLAHESIVTTFADITSRDVQDKIWERHP